MVKKLPERFLALLLILLCFPYIAGCAQPKTVEVHRPTLEAPTAPNVKLPPATPPSAVPTPAETPTPHDNPNAPAPEATPIDDPDQKKVYLTFDDGPSPNTDAILKILTDKGVTATFFVIGTRAEEYPTQLKNIVAQGSVVGNHTYSHKTNEIYKSKDALLADIERNRALLADALGESYPLDLFRFPKGSTNKGCRNYRWDVANAGYRYFDWNALNGDAETTQPRTAEQLYERFKQTVDDVDGRKKEVIVLMHDTKSKTATVEMLPQAIDYLFSLGYVFRTLDTLPNGLVPPPTSEPTQTPASTPAPIDEPAVPEEMLPTQEQQPAPAQTLPGQGTLPPAPEEAPILDA